MQKPDIPKHVLHNIGEFCDGFILISITQEGTLEVHDHLKNTLQHMAILKYMDQYIRHNDEVALSEYMDSYLEEETPERKDESDTE